MKIYAVGCLQIDEKPNARHIITDQRLWHLFRHLDEAQEALINNRGDLFERSYNYGLIEEVHVIDKQDIDPPKLYTHMNEWWYKADYSTACEANDYNPSVTLCEKPAVLERIVYFWIG